MLRYLPAAPPAIVIVLKVVTTQIRLVSVASVL